MSASEIIPYEQDAMLGKEMPKGMEYPDQILYLQLRMLYDTYKRGLIDRETAKGEKAELLREYKAHKIVDDCGKEWVYTIKETELARAEYRKNPCHENAMKLIEIIEGRKV
jgi:hypothetical protein